ncbi:hypothetical protein ACFSMW_14805 [Virgibacillus halophilus]|uniref:hypothetical protein n=1 Tax=Tigheibacillus halophilus TaxID=361280 RepID=UPI003641D01A
MKKVNVTLIKGPNFEQVEKMAYGLLHDILLEKAMEQDGQKASNQIPKKVAND